jgi:hypothetical protein
MSKVFQVPFDKELFDLKPEEAESLLREFLETEQAFFLNFCPSGMNVDYSHKSVLHLFDCAICDVKASAITEVEFDGVWSLRVGFYFGEALRKTSKKLKWAVGSKNYAQENHPVLSGFNKRVEAPMIMISHNVISAVVFDKENVDRAKNVVNTWFDLAK